MEHAADHSPLADLALALAEIDALSVARLSRNHNAPIEADLLALRAAVSRASVSLRKIEFWLRPETRTALTALPSHDGAGAVPSSAQRIIVAFRRTAPAAAGDPLCHPGGECSLPE